MSEYVDSPVLVDLTTPTQSPRSEQDSDVEIIEIIDGSTENPIVVNVTPTPANLIAAPSTTTSFNAATSNKAHDICQIILDDIINNIDVEEEDDVILIDFITRSPRSGDEDFVVFHEAPESPSSDKSHSGLTTSVSEDSSYQPEFSNSSEESSPSPNSNQEEILTIELQELKNQKTNFDKIDSTKVLHDSASKKRKMKTQPKPKPKKRKTLRNHRRQHHRKNNNQQHRKDKRMKNMSCMTEENSSKKIKTNSNVKKRIAAFVQVLLYGKILGPLFTRFFELGRKIYLVMGKVLKLGFRVLEVAL